MDGQTCEVIDSRARDYKFSWTLMYFCPGTDDQMTNLPVALIEHVETDHRSSLMKQKDVSAEPQVGDFLLFFCLPLLNQAAAQRIAATCPHELV